MKAVYWIFLCSTLSVYAMQPLTKEDVQNLERQKIELIKECDRIVKNLSEADEQTHEKYQALLLALREVRYALEKYPRRKGNK